MTSRKALLCKNTIFRAFSQVLPVRGSASFSTHLGVPTSTSQQKMIDTENKYGAHNYHPIEVVIDRGEGIHVFDVDGKRYYDFLAAYSAVNQGHCHPRLINALVTQAKTLNLTSRAFFNSKLPDTLTFLHEYFGTEMGLMMNSGAEAVETAFKVARKWGYESKGIPENKAKIIFCENNFHGRTMVCVSASTDPTTQKNFGPFLPGIEVIQYNDLEALKTAVADPNVCAFIVEPIQGEAGVYVPDEGYLSGANKICKEANVLFIADEVQTGLGRTGKRLCIDWEDVKPDLIVMGKALSGGLLPVSAVVGSEAVLGHFTAGTHGSTFGGNPMACAVANEALQILKDENLFENSVNMGSLFRQLLNEIKSPYVKLVRGKGLMNAVVIEPREDGREALDLCYLLRDNGLLAKPTHGDIIRFTPPLCINEQQIRESVEIIEKSLEQYAKF